MANEIKEVEKEIKEDVKEVKKEAGKMEEKIKKFFNNEQNLIYIIIALIAILVIILLFPDSVKIFSSGEKVYSLDIIKIESNDDLFDLNSVVLSVEQNTNIKIRSEKEISYNSDEEAKKLIEKYKIQKIPALIVLGNVEKIGLDASLFRIEEKTGIFDKAVPYLDLKTNEIKGIVDLIELYDSNCKECGSYAKIQQAFDNSGIKTKKYELVSYQSERGKKLAEENSLSVVPSLLISKNLNEYWWVFSSINPLLNEKNEYFIFSSPVYPYKEIKTGKITGKVIFTYLVNNSCFDCYNVSMLKEAFVNLGVYVASEKSIDIASDEGKELIKSYNIAAIPTAILSDEISDYENIKQTLEQVGTYENKKYVFRNLDVLNAKYQKLSEFT